MVFGRKAFFGHVTDPVDRSVLWFINLPRRHEPTPEELAALGPEEWREHLLAAVADDDSPAAALIGATPARYDWSLMHQMDAPARWHRGRTVLIGDAAHLTPPFIGQGLGAGLRDAANLCWKLAGVLEGGLPPSVLDTYESERRPHVRQLIVLAIWIGTAMTRGGRAGDVLRRLIAPRLHWVPGLRAKVLDSATPRLRSGELVLRRPGQRGLAGTLCPNVPLDGARRFDDVVGARFALVACAPLANRDRLAALAAGAAVIEAKPGQPLHDWLTRGRALHQAAVIVRPDGTELAATKASRDAILLLPTGNRVTQE
jgi:3-(3-hydroxy-phenyl)propionate hydroxylase